MKHITHGKGKILFWKSIQKKGPLLLEKNTLGKLEKLKKLIKRLSSTLESLILSLYYIYIYMKVYETLDYLHKVYVHIK